MTTVACTLSQMACDSFATFGGLAVRMQKVFKLPGRLIGCSGDVSAFTRFIDWQRAGGKLTERPDFSGSSDNEFDALELTPGGIWQWDQTLARMSIEEDNWAIGSGADIALYAMRVLHLSPEDAVREAAKIDIRTMLPVRTYELPGRARRR